MYHAHFTLTSGGSKFPIPLHQGSQSLELVHTKPYYYQAACLAGIQNITVDSLSRHFFQDHEWEINPNILHPIFHQWGTLQIDLFTTEANKKCTHVCSRSGLGSKSLRDAFQLQWLSTLLYMFPPTPLIGKTLLKTKKE